MTRARATPGAVTSAHGSTAPFVTHRVTDRPLPLGLALRPLEVATGTPIGSSGRRLPAVDATPGDVRRALEDVVRRALRRAPCVVSFSGGRDSSAVLAVAAHVARREDLPPPVPVTLAFPRVASTDEHTWQRRVLEHLGLTDRWVRLEVHDELDVVGPRATAQARRHGLLWPYNTHFHQPVLDRAAGGSLLTGIGGDELLLPADEAVTNRLVAERGWHALPPREVLRRLGHRAPGAFARLGARRRRHVPVSWLRPAARASHHRALVDQRAHEPPGWASWVRRHWWGLRFRELSRATFDVIAGPHDVVVRHPLADRDVLCALAGLGGDVGFPDRTAAMSLLAGDLLPEAVVARDDKARFDEVFYARHAVAAARGWDGGGLDTSWLDPAALRLHLPAVPAAAARRGRDNRAWMLLQALVLTGHA